MAIRQTIYAAMAYLVLPASAVAAPLVATEVEVFDTKNTYANAFGVVVSESRLIPGVGALGEDENGQPKIAFLGCRFDVFLERSDRELNQAVEAINRKIATSDMAVPSGVGYLRNPTPISITDPVTVTQCDPGKYYPFYLFRNSTFMGSVTIEFIVFEYDDEGFNVFRSSIFNDEFERTSLTTARIVSAASGLYRVNYMSPEDIESDSEEKSALVQKMLLMAPSLLTGVPIP